jgi:hypothetical protein
MGSRLLVIELAPGVVAGARLSACQQAAADGQ